MKGLRLLWPSPTGDAVSDVCSDCWGRETRMYTDCHSKYSRFDSILLLTILRHGIKTEIFLMLLILFGVFTNYLKHCTKAEVYVP